MINDQQARYLVYTKYACPGAHTQPETCPPPRAGQQTPPCSVGRCAGPREIRVSEPRSKAVRSRRAFEPEQRRIFPVRLSPAEREQLDRLAAKKGVSVGRLLVESALSGTWDRDLRQSILTSLWRTDRLLANVTGSLNQLAHQANIAEQVVAERQLRKSLREFAGLRGELTEVLKGGALTRNIRCAPLLAASCCRWPQSGPIV